MPEPRQHEDVDAEAFHTRVRDHMNESVEGDGHHPFGGYQAAAFRHYTRRRALMTAMRSLRFDSALDVGCAQGWFMNEMHQEFGCEVWGVDISEGAAASVKERYGYPAAGADGMSLPFADGAFDLVYCTETIEHVLDPAALLAELRRVARRHVLVTTPISQARDEHEPDYELRDEGHINDFDLGYVRELFGPNADIRTFRNNATFALVKGVGRRLPGRLHDAFYILDHRFSQRVGGPSRIKPLRNRDWLVIVPGGGASGPREWRAPGSHVPLVETPDGLRCDADGKLFRWAAPGVPDFLRSTGTTSPS